MEAPALYAAIDALAARAAAWGERRQRQALQRPGAAEDGAATPEDAGLRAALAVKRVMLSCGRCERSSMVPRVTVRACRMDLSVTCILAGEG